MPQLNPNPWFLILSSTWLIYIFIFQPKIMSYLSMNNPTNKTMTTLMNAWIWPWT